MSFRCTVLTPERIAFQGEVAEAVLPAHDGELGILPGHADFLGALGQGVARLKTVDGTKVMALDGGYLRMDSGTLTVLAREALAKEALDRAAVEKAVADALAEKPKDPAEAGRRDERLGWARARLRALA